MKCALLPGHHRPAFKRQYHRQSAFSAPAHNAFTIPSICACFSSQISPTHVSGRTRGTYGSSLQPTSCSWLQQTLHRFREYPKLNWFPAVKCGCVPINRQLYVARVRSLYLCNTFYSVYFRNTLFRCQQLSPIILPQLAPEMVVA